MRGRVRIHGPDPYDTRVFDPRPSNASRLPAHDSRCRISTRESIAHARIIPSMTRILILLCLLLCGSTWAETRYYLVEGAIELPTGRRVATSLSLAKRTV